MVWLAVSQWEYIEMNSNNKWSQSDQWGWTPGYRYNSLLMAWRKREEIVNECSIS